MSQVGRAVLAPGSEQPEISAHPWLPQAVGLSPRGFGLPRAGAALPGPGQGRWSPDPPVPQGCSCHLVQPPGWAWGSPAMDRGPTLSLHGPGPAHGLCSISELPQDSPQASPDTRAAPECIWPLPGTQRWNLWLSLAAPQGWSFPFPAAPGAKKCFPGLL